MATLVFNARICDSIIDFNMPGLSMSNLNKNTM